MILNSKCSEKLVKKKKKMIIGDIDKQHSNMNDNNKKRTANIDKINNNNRT